MEDYVEIIFSIVGAFLGYFLGDFDGFIHALLTVVIIDYVSGVLAAGVNHELSSSVGFRGIAKKIMMFTIVGLAHVIDFELLGHTAVLRDAVIFFYIANEGLSILENAVNIGIPIPESIRERLLGMKNEETSIGDEKKKKIRRK